MSENAIHCCGLSVAQGTFAMENIHLELKKGFITGLIGRNGSGKTTLIKGIAGCLPSSNGKVTFGNLKSLESKAEINRLLSVVYDQPHFSIKSTPKGIAEDVALFEPDFNMNYFNEKMKFFQLDPKKRLNNYSAGMLKKFMLILALARNPEILVLDEPTSGVDPVSRIEMLDLIQEFMENENHTVLFSTHITSDLDKIADYIALVDQGKLQFIEEKEALKQHYMSHDFLPNLEEIMCQTLMRRETENA